MVPSGGVTIDWRSWDEARAAARAAGEPLLVLVTNRFSHAAHQLDQLLDDGDLAAALRPWLRARVDCDERPDVDVALQPDRGRPTWPLVAWLSPDGAARAVWSHLDRPTLLARLREPPSTPLPSPPPPPRATVDEALAAIAAAYDRHNGGFETPPKRPRPSLLDLLLALGRRGDFDGRPLAQRTLDALVQGGIHDQLGGGFHLYSTDERWVVPHFEKRAADQAALLRTFARAAAITGQPRYAAVARRIIAYVECRLALDGGGYAACEDADVGAYDDGSHYTWSVEEVRAVLDGDELAVAQPYFDLYGRGELHSDPTRNILFVAASPDEVARELGRDVGDVQRWLARARDRLLQARGERPAPAVDETPYAGVFARMARAYLEAEAALGTTHDRDRALATLDRLYAARLPDGGVPHRLDDARSLRWLADHAELGLAAVRAYEATRDERHLVVARQLADCLLAQFWHSDGGFTRVPVGDAGVDDVVAAVARERPSRDGEDGSGPSANAVAGTFLHVLGAHTREPLYAERARSLVEALLPWACGAGVDGAGLIYLRLVLGIGI
jgi:uncharacterized protein YyaL (SSP411 family)